MNRRRRLIRYVVLASCFLLVAGTAAFFADDWRISRKSENPVSQAPDPTAEISGRSEDPVSRAPDPTAEISGNFASLETHDVWTELSPGWNKLARPPLPRAKAEVVWMDSELFLWGGKTLLEEPSNRNEGFIYNKSTGKWRAASLAPIEGRVGAASVWTGREVLIWGGEGFRGSFSDGATYNPATDTWREMAPAPLAARSPAASVWTGKEMIVWGGRSRGAGTLSDGAAYDPETDSWRVIEEAPTAVDYANVTWTGKQMVVYGARGLSPIGLLVFDPAWKDWNVVEIPDLTHPISVIWSPKGLLAFDRKRNAAVYNSRNASWSEMPSSPSFYFECAPNAAYTRNHVLAWNCGQGATFDLEKNVWEELTLPKELRDSNGLIVGNPVSADGAILFAGATEGGDFNALWAYRP